MDWFEDVNCIPLECNKDMTDYKQQNKHPGPFFIALSGKKQVGKDTAAQWIVELMKSRNKTIAVTAFADPLKQMCIDILGLKKSEVYGTDATKNALSNIKWDGFPEEVRLKYANEFVKCNDGVTDPIPRSGTMTNREVLQVVGTDIFRNIYNNVWANAPFNRNWEGVDVVVLTDCRFPNEKIATEEHGGVIIRLIRNTGFVDNHPSEIALDNECFENQYLNNGSIDDLKDFISAVLKKNGII